MLSPTEARTELIHSDSVRVNPHAFLHLYIVQEGPRERVYAQEMATLFAWQSSGSASDPGHVSHHFARLSLDASSVGGFGHVQSHDVLPFRPRPPTSDTSRRTLHQPRRNQHHCRPRFTRQDSDAMAEIDVRPSPGRGGLGNRKRRYRGEDAEVDNRPMD